MYTADKTIALCAQVVTSSGCAPALTFPNFSWAISLLHARQAEDIENGVDTGSGVQELHWVISMPKPAGNTQTR
jgi:hypothetical protein